MKYKKFLRGVFIGDYNVGKTSLATRIFDDKFTTTQSTIGVEFRSSIFNDIKIAIWDTGGSERYRSIIPMYFRNVDFILIVLDKSDGSILETYHYWKSMVERHAREGTPCRVIINKRDLPGDVPPELPADALLVSAKADSKGVVMKMLLPFLESLEGHRQTSTTTISKPRESLYSCC